MNYYNEIDRHAAAWLRELIADGHIPPGHVDERSIIDVKPHELTEFTQQHFFAGIGGWSLALRLAGVPDTYRLRTGSCPCQPFSQAGQGLAEEDPRHVWPYFRNLIAFGEPAITFGEQVASPAGRKWLAGIRADLEGLGYEVGAADLCAAGVGAPHIRQRLFWVANPNGRLARNGKLQRRRRYNEQSKDEAALRMGHANRPRPQPGRQASAANGYGGAAVSNGGLSGMGNAESWEQWRSRESEPSLRRTCETGGSSAWSDFDILHCLDGKARRVESGTFPLAHGVSGRVGLLRGYGNAIVPQVAAEFIQAALESI